MSKRPLDGPGEPSSDAAGTKPKVSTAAMRQRLGGPRELAAGAVGTEREGTLVAFKGAPVLVLHEDPGEGACDLWLGDGRALRVSIDRLTPLEADASVPRDLARVTEDLRLFLSLRAKSAVRFLAGDGTIREGTLVEQCKFGGLVALSDGTVLGIGFARFLPLTGHGSPNDLHLS